MGQKKEKKKLDLAEVPPEQVQRNKNGPTRTGVNNTRVGLQVRAGNATEEVSDH